MAGKDDKPAFPLIVDLSADKTGCQNYGLTRLELFAAMAMAGLLANPDHDKSAAGTADYARRHADALIAELDKEPTR